MRPVSNFLIMQLSNSRREPGEYSENVKDTKQNCKMTAGGVCAIIPSLTVEKKNECHNP